MGAVAEGFSFGIGSAIARNLVNSMWPGGGSEPPLPPPPAPPPADTFEHSYNDDSHNSGSGDSGDDGDDLF